MTDSTPLDDYIARAHLAETKLDIITDWILTEEREHGCCDHCRGYQDALDDIDAIIAATTPSELPEGRDGAHVETVKFGEAYREAL